MKKIVLQLIAILLFSYSGYSKKVDERTAKQVGANFLKTVPDVGTNNGSINLQLAYKVEYRAKTDQAESESAALLYVFNQGDHGYVMVSGDDRVIPILAYSNESKFDPNDIPPNARKWIEGYKTQIRDAIETELLPTESIENDWKNYYEGKIITGGAEASVSPLMTTKWGQSPYVNALCPSNSVTGCVATAMAQIMKYWNYPANGTGFHSYNHSTYGTLSANFGSTAYNWSAMPNVVNSSNSAVATLMYQVGVSVDMDYGPASTGGSGAYVISSKSPVTHCSEYSLKTYFGYKNALQGIERSNYSQSQWLNLMKTELNANRPILYAGFGSGGGHCFVADGYDANDFLHFNWGWGGSYDGYFQINSLNPLGVGTGGGSGSYNSGQQAVIGIEPPANAQVYDMKLYDYVASNKNPIGYGQSFEISTNILNDGTNTFNGDYCAAIFDDQSNFIDYVEIRTGFSLAGGYRYTNNLVFKSSGLYSMVPGTYHASVFYRPTGGSWTQVGKRGSYTNYIQLTVTNNNDMKLNSAISITQGTTLTKGQPINVNLNVVNRGNSTFYGQFEVNLYNLDGSFAQSVGVVTESSGLPVGYTYNAPYLSFSNSSVTIEPGTYLLALHHKPTGSSRELTGTGSFLNPIKVTVKLSSIPPDQYEVNDQKSQAYNFTASFSGNVSTVKTTGSTIHTGSDNDFYAVNLASGYNYSISARLHDSYSSGNGNTYTVDALFSYSEDGIIWSDAYDDVMSGSVSVANGGKVYFQVAPYFAGEKGTYLLDITITRAKIVLNPDIYENNNTVNLSYSLPISFNGGVTLVKTTGSNIHESTDIDYYMMYLESGFDYTINPTLYDKNFVLTGDSFSLDAQFYFSTDKINWSNAIDDSYIGNIQVQNGDDIYFRVIPKNSGEIGSYLLDCIVSRSANNVGQDEIELGESILVFPNPTSDVVNIHWGDQVKDVKSITILNNQGQVIIKKYVESSSIQEEFNLGGVSEGLYFVNIELGSGTLTRKVNIVK